MSRSTVTLTETISDYVHQVGFREPDVLRRLREETAGLPEARMQISPEQGQLMSTLVRFGGVRRALEVGTFTGYSSLCVALAMGPEGRLVCCDVNQEWTSIARRYWQEAGVADRIDLVLAPALETLNGMLAKNEGGHYDFAFIDADKRNYEGYYEAALALLRPGGMVAVDNVLWSGKVADPNDHSGDTDTLRNFNEKLRHDPRIHLSMVPIGDGLTLALKL
ncbi:MAG TPA: class I SAM-dependent methyltransferase [Candidatus Xenobia bacterium]|jgi:predicted O-methyltransferase YrrM